MLGFLFIPTPKLSTYNVFCSHFKEAKEKNGNVPFDEWKTIYYCLPLLVSLVKYDATGEIVNPAVMYEYLMPEFERFAVFDSETDGKVKVYLNIKHTRVYIKKIFVTI